MLLPAEETKEQERWKLPRRKTQNLRLVEMLLLGVENDRRKASSLLAIFARREAVAAILLGEAIGSGHVRLRKTCES